MEKNGGKILSIQALRALAFLGIFLRHAGAPTREWSFLGVSIFFVLSGYLMFCRYGNQEMHCSARENAHFSWTKIRKLYPLHIITMCLAAVLDLAISFRNGITVKDIVSLAAKIGLNITLLQTWVPYSSVNVCLNGVAWYLSVTMFLYFMFPYVKQWVGKIGNKILMIICITIPVVEIFTCIPWIRLLGPDSPVYIWFMYCFPIFRLGDFFIGCCMGKCLKEEELRDTSSAKVSAMEALATVLTISVLIWTKQDHANTVLIAAKNWTTLYIPLAVIWIWLFVINRGAITKLLTNKLTVFIGNISAYAFLIHYVVTKYFGSVINFLGLNLSTGQNVIKILLELLLSIAAATLYDRYKNKNKGIKE